jgi:hypothetical protein
MFFLMMSISSGLATRDAAAGIRGVAAATSVSVWMAACVLVGEGGPWDGCSPAYELLFFKIPAARLSWL